MGRLIQNRFRTKHVFILSFFSLFSIFVFADKNRNLYEIHLESGIAISHFFAQMNPGLDISTPSETSDKNLTTLSSISTDSIQEFRTLAIAFAEKNQAKESTKYIVKYIAATTDMSFLNDHLFANIKNSDEYQALKEKYDSKIGLLGFFYFCAGVLGLFVFVVLNLKSSIDRTNTFLISLFVLFHSVFILHLVLYVMNIQFYLPHALFASTTFSFLYGPLLYFYFKRVIYNYKFKLVDILHLVPSIILLIYILPYYLMSRGEKFNEIFDQANTLLPGAYTIIVVKILSLSIYAYLLISIYRKNRDIISNKGKNKYLWQRNIIALHTVYAMAYVIYAAVLVKIINFPVLFHLQTFVMVCVVFYVAYIAYEQPEIFKGTIKLIDPLNFLKYKNSGLTPTYSSELKDHLIKLIHEEKIYKQNDITLDILSERLGTTRHNTSQVINEHFKMNFSELINKYRIGEAKEILENDAHHNLSIIQVAYEVGFNNRVTFYKSFKKQLSQSPSDYLKSQKM